MINNTKKSVLSFTLILLIVLSSTGCIKEEFDPSKFDASLDLKSGVAIPIGFSHLGFEKYLQDSLLKDKLRIDKNGFLSLYYTTAIDSGVMGDLLSINDASGNTSVLNQTGSVLFLNIPGATLDISDSLNIVVTSTQADARIDSIKLLSGTIQLNVISSNLAGTVTFTINGLIQNGIPFSASRNLSNPGFALSLAGYTILPEHDAAGNNLLKCKLSIHLQTPSGPVNPGSTIMGVNATINNLEYETIYGDFGGYTIDFPAQTIPTPFFSQLTDGQILFADPKFKLFFENSVGVPFGIYFNRIDAIDRNNISYPLTGQGVPGTGNPKIIRYPSLNQEGLTMTDSLVFNRNNSNLSDFIATCPDSVTVQGAAEIIKLTPPDNSFIRFDSKYNISAVIELPLWGKAKVMVLLDTMDFDYLNSTLPPPEEIERLIIRTSITNSFPVTAYPQIYLLDANRMLLDSLFTGSQKIEGATDTNGDGKADPHKQPPIDIDLPRSRIDNLLNTRYLLVKGSIMTTDFPLLDVKLYTTYFLDCNIGLIAQLKINTGKR